MAIRIIYFIVCCSSNRPYNMARQQHPQLQQRLGLFVVWRAIYRGSGWVGLNKPPKTRASVRGFRFNRITPVDLLRTQSSIYILRSAHSLQGRRNKSPVWTDYMACHSRSVISWSARKINICSRTKT